MTQSNPYHLSHGSHRTAEDGRCAMEWVSYLAGEPHSDQPQCVSPVLRRFCIALNDRLEDADRQKLRPYLARTIGTAGDGRDEERLRLCREFVVRHSLPYYLDAAGRSEAAAPLRALPDALTAEATWDAIRFARDEAWSAREQAVDRLADRVRGELAKRGLPAVADADVAAAVAADVAAVAVPSLALRNELRRLLREKAIERAREFNQQFTPQVFALLDRMLPTEVIQLPVVEDAPLVCDMPGLEVASR